MKKPAIALALLLPLSIAFSGENALFRHSDSCLKYPPSDARTQCMVKEREAAATVKKELLGEEVAAKPTDSGPSKKNELCYTRKTTGEVVCPN